LEWYTQKRLKKKMEMIVAHSNRLLQALLLDALLAIRPALGQGIFRQAGADARRQVFWSEGY